MKILAVDDDAVARMAIKGMITQLGHTCLLAGDGLEAWQILQEQRMDVVISDWIMPRSDGIELCRKIRARRPEDGYVYVLLASAHHEDHELRDGMIAGADDFLTKPLAIAALERKLIAADRVTTLHGRLAAAQQSLAHTNQLQADMIAMLGHDARSPLTAIIGYSEANLEDWETVPDDIKRSMVAKVAKAARRLDALIEDVLTMANLDSGEITCRTQAVAVVHTIHDAISAEPEPFPVAVAGDETTQAQVDPWQFRQIMVNLIGNAVKYGSPPIAVMIESTGDRVKIKVSDTGEGVPPGFVPHLFDRFTRADTGVATRKAGTGFGLYISQRLAEVNQGHITYASGFEGGSCFTLDLPRGEGTPADVAERQRSAIPSG